MRKFEGHGKPGILIGYAPLQGLVIIDIEAWKKDEIHVILTRDVQVHPNEFPFLDLFEDEEEELEADDLLASACCFGEAAMPGSRKTAPTGRMDQAQCPLDNG